MPVRRSPDEREVQGATPTTVSQRDFFVVLSAWWHEATDHISSPSEKAAHPAYRAIVDMGEAAVPFILEELDEHGGEWYIALRRILGDRSLPTPKGTTRQINTEWVQWGRENRFSP